MKYGTKLNQLTRIPPWTKGEQKCKYLPHDGRLRIFDSILEVAQLLNSRAILDI